MANCQNCGAFVTEAYARVFTPDDVDQPRVCPNCPDKLREKGEVRDARGSRQGSKQDSVKYDPEKAGEE